MSVQYEDGVFEELLNCSAYLADVPVDDGIKLLHLLHSAVDYKRVFENDF